MNKNFLAEVKKRLLAEKNKLEEGINKLAERGNRRVNIRFTDFGSKDDENANEVRALSENTSLENDLERGLAEVNKALTSVEKGGYGFCELCGQKINDERLKIFPAATFCVECKKKENVRF